MSLVKNGEYFDEDFKALEFNGEDLSGVIFENCSFTGCSFQESVFDNCSLDGCKFRDCNLSVVSLNRAKITDTKFLDCKLVGIKWYYLNTKLGFDCQWRSCDLGLGNFSEMDLSKSMIEDCECKEVYLAGCNMTKLNLGKTNLDGAIFDNTSLEKADLSKAYNYIINPNLNNIKKAKFSLPEAVGLLKNLDINIVE